MMDLAPPSCSTLLAPLTCINQASMPLVVQMNIWSQGLIQHHTRAERGAKGAGPPTSVMAITMELATMHSTMDPFAVLL